MFIGCFFWPASLKHMVRCQRGIMEFYECATFIITAVAESSETPGAGCHGWRCYIPGIRITISEQSSTIARSLSSVY